MQTVFRLTEKVVLYEVSLRCLEPAIIQSLKHLVEISPRWNLEQNHRGSELNEIYPLVQYIPVSFGIKPTDDFFDVSISIVERIADQSM